MSWYKNLKIVIMDSAEHIRSVKQSSNVLPVGSLEMIRKTTKPEEVEIRRRKNPLRLKMEDTLMAPVLEKVTPGVPSIKIRSFSEEEVVPLLETYRGQHIVMTGKNVSVWDPKRETLFVVALDDSKTEKPYRFIVPEANTVENAKKYIDWVLGVRAKQGELLEESVSYGKEKRIKKQNNGWYKNVTAEYQYRKNQKDFHRDMVSIYLRKRIEAVKQLHRYAKEHNERMTEQYQEKIEKIDEILDHHYDQILYYTRREEKDELFEETGIKLV